MYRILVVDDEPFIVEGLYTLINDMGNVEFDVYKSNSSIEALNFIKRTKTDIVLTDINMPGINGIEMNKQIKLLLPKCKVIFLTGFNDFQYIQSAIREGGVDYILKTEGDAAIVNAINVAIKKIDSEVKNEALVENAKANMRIALPSLRENFFIELLNGKKYRTDNIQKYFNELEIKFRLDNSIALLIGRVDKWSKDTTITKRMEIIYGIQSIVEKYIGNISYMVPIIYDETSLAWILQKKDIFRNEEEIIDGNYDYISLLKGNMDYIQNTCRYLLKISISFITNDAMINWEDIAEKFESLKFNLNDAVSINQGVLITDSAFMKVYSKGNNKVAADYAIRNEIKKIPLLESYFEKSEKSEFMVLYEEIMNVIFKDKNLPYNLSNEVYYSISLIFITCLNKWNLNETISPFIDLSRLTAIQNYSNWDEIKIYFRQLAECIFEQKKDDFSDRTDKIISTINLYIKGNLHGDISLNKIAELVHFNPAYLSRFYKQVTGRGISDFIFEAKITKSKEMLVLKNYKINEVATAVGFDNASYFARFFKKHTNLTPQEYRDLFKEGIN